MENLANRHRTIASIMTVGTHGIAFADPKHCDRPGWPDCFDVGKGLIPGY